MLTSELGRCLFCRKDKLRIYRLPDSPSRHVFCDGCGASGPWGDTYEEAVSLYGVAKTCSQCDGSGFEGDAQMPCSLCGGDGWLPEHESKLVAERTMLRERLAGVHAQRRKLLMLVIAVAELGCLRGRQVHCAEREADPPDWCVACQAKYLTHKGTQ